MYDYLRASLRLPPDLAGAERRRPGRRGSVHEPSGVGLGLGALRSYDAPRMNSSSYRTLNELFSECRAEFSTRPAIGTKTERGFEWVSFEELGVLIDRARAGLHALGIERGQRVAIVSDNRLEWAVLAFATYSLGANYVPMYQAQAKDEWAYIIQDSEAAIVVGATGPVFEQLTEICATQSSVRHVIGLDLPESDPRSYKSLMKASPDVPVVEVAPDDLAVLIYTSGTTGSPKGVCLSHDNISSNVRGALERFDFREGDCSLAFLPWAHVFGQTCELYSLLRAGASLALNDEVPNLVSNLAVVRPSVLVAVPRIFNRIYDGVGKQMAEKPAPIRALFKASVELATRRSRGEPLSTLERITLSLGDKLIFSKVRQKFGGRLRFVVSGSAALSPVVAEFIDALGIDVFEGYGLTETSPVVAANYPNHRKIGTVGPPFPGVDVRIDIAATEDPVQGEIQVRGDNVMKGYYKKPEDTQQVFTEDGWFRTGDMGYLDDEGFLHITGRIKEQYKLENGKYVVPSPLEEEFKLSPFIANIMIHGANRPYNVALVVLDVVAVELWAKQHGAAEGDLTQSPRVKELILKELEKYSGAMKGYEKIRDVSLITEDFTTENGMLTPKMSLKRRNVTAKYGERLEALYASS